MGTFWDSRWLCPVLRYAVTSVEAACHRWRENHYPESHRPAEVGASSTLRFPPSESSHEHFLHAPSLLLSVLLQTPGTTYCFYGSLSIPFRKDHEKAEFEVHEVYAVDVLVSSGEGKVRRVY